MFLKVSPTKDIWRFGVQGRLSPRYIGPYEIIKKLNPIAYPLHLLIDLEHVHDVFYVSQFRKYIPDPDNAVIIEPIEVTADLAYEERPIQILECRVKQLCNK